MKTSQPTGLEPSTAVKLKEFSITERAEFKKCRRRWFLGTVHRLERHTGGTALAFGTAMHEGLYAYYKALGKSVDERTVAAKKAFIESWQGEMDRVAEILGFLWSRAAPEYDELLELGNTMLDGYAAEYGDDPEFSDIVLQEVRLRFRVPGTTMWVTGRLDIAIRANGDVEAWDHKTSASSYNANHLDIDDQLSGYAWLYEKSQGEVPGGVGHNHLMKKGPLTKSGKPTTSQLFSRDQTFRTRAQIEEFERNLILEARDMRKVAANPELAYPAPNAMICNGCPVRMLCVAMMNDEDTEDLITHNYVVAPVRQ